MFTRIPPTFLFVSSPSPPTRAYMSFGHFNLILSPHFPNTFSSLHASTTANAKRYCINTSLFAGNDARDTLWRIENWRHPDGESQTLFPRPRPANWCDAIERRGVGSWVSRFGFLSEVGRTLLSEWVETSTHLSSMVCVLVIASP